ncbi:hypothetical protein FRB98_007306 [Tulasnella sp. 332]|nr:hypothetical protein FRB98_007306 [Tulasnella sp. 332]
MTLDPIKLNDGRKVIRIPSIAFGTGSALRGRDAVEYVVQAIYAGFSHIDTAQAYQNESSTGAALKETGIARNDVWITTKFYYLGPSGLNVRDALVESLNRMSLEYVDLYLIHSPPPNIPETWGEMEMTLKEGLTKSIGVSNFNVEQLELLMMDASVVPAVNQILFNPYQLGEMLPVLQYCKEHGIVVEAYGPLTSITKAPNGPVDAPVKKAADRLKATPGQVLLLWVRQKGCVIVTTSSKAERLEEYLGIAELGPLTDEEMQAIDEAGLKGAPRSLLQFIKTPRSTLKWIRVLLMVFAFSFLSYSTFMRQYGSGLIKDVLSIIPSIAFGTGSALYGQDVVEYVVQAIHAGFSHIDTAQAYKNESSTGVALKETGIARNDIWITTKFHFLRVGATNVRDDLVQSLNKIRFNPYQLREMLPVLLYCKKHGIVIEAYGPLGFITKAPNGPVDAPVEKAADRLKATPAQVLLLWIRQKGCVIVTTSSKTKRLEECMGVAELGPLTDEEMQAIDDAGLKGAPRSVMWSIGQVMMTFASVGLTYSTFTRKYGNGLFADALAIFTWIFMLFALVRTVLLTISIEPAL